MGVLQRLREIGVRIAMGDFGTGHSSLGCLRSFPFDMVKIDRSFVGDLGVRKDGDAIVRALTHLCDSLGIATTAEGVETEAQLALLGDEFCTEAQGFLFSVPRPASEIPRMLRELTPRGGAIEKL
jgi:EAL domain-containing protein (putative c-di-GMP-specific phosphodiesterase class I)